MSSGQESSRPKAGTVGDHRRRINTEEEAKVVTAVWGTEFNQFLIALSILHQDDLKKKDE